MYTATLLCFTPYYLPPKPCFPCLIASTFFLISEEMLKLYCSKVGLEFEQSMIDWNETNQQMAVRSFSDVIVVYKQTPAAMGVRYIF